MTRSRIPSRAQAAEGAIAFVDVASLSIAKIVIPEHGVLHDLTRVGRKLQCIALVLQLSGSATCEQDAHCIRLEQGQWDAFDMAPLHITADHSGAQQLVLLIPEELLEDDAARIKGSARPLSGVSGLGKLVCQTAICLFDELPRIGLRRGVDLAETLCRLLRLVIHETNEGEAPLPASPHHKLRQRAKDYVDRHLSDPHLSVEGVARQLTCTPRYLQKAFQETGQTLSRYIWQQRLNRCYEDLLDPALSDKHITEIALSWGFNSVTHFSEAFRNRFGASPRAMRRRLPASTQNVAGTPANDDPSAK